MSHFGGGVAERKGYGTFFISARARWRVEKELSALIRFSYAELEKRFKDLESRVRYLEEKFRDIEGQLNL